MRIEFGSTKCGLLAIYMILVASSAPFRSIGGAVAATISLALAILCLLVPFDKVKEEEEDQNEDV